MAHAIERAFEVNIYPEEPFFETLVLVDVIGAPSTLRLTRKAAAFARVLPTFARNWAENAAL